MKLEEFKWAGMALLTPALILAHTPGAQIRQSIGLTRFGVAGPVTGSQVSAGTVELTANAPPPGVVIRLTSSNPAVASVPATVTVAPGTRTQSVKVTTYAVAAETVVTLSAQAGTDVKTSTLTVIPPALSLVSCKPNSAPSGATVTCTVWLTGTVAGAPSVRMGTGRTESAGLTVALATSNAAVATAPANVTVGPGQHQADFQVATKPLPQTASVTLSGSYAGVTKTAPLTVLPVSIRLLYCRQGSDPLPPVISGGPACETIPGAGLGSLGNLYVSGFVSITAPAPAGGVTLRLSASSSLAVLGAYPGSADAINSLVVPEGKDGAAFAINPKPVAADTPVVISAFAPVTGETRTATLTIRPANLVKLRFQDDKAVHDVANVPLGGTQVTLLVTLDGLAPPEGAIVQMSYSGGTDVKGPPEVKVPHNSRAISFPVTVSPCAINPPCQVVITAVFRGAQHKATIWVRP